MPQVFVVNKQGTVLPSTDGKGFIMKQAFGGKEQFSWNMLSFEMS